MTSQESETTDSVRTGVPPTGKSAQRGRSANSAALKSRKRSPADKMNALKKQEEKQRQLDQAATKDISKKSKKPKKVMKSKKSAKSSKKMASTKSGKSRKGAKAPGDIAFPPNKSPKSKKSMKSKKVVLPPLGQSGAEKKVDNINNQPKNTSVYLPGVMDNVTPAANKFMKKADTGKSTKSLRKFNEIPAYNFPGAGKCTRNMEQVAPPTPKANNDQSHCVYDVAQLPAAQRRLQPKPEGCSGSSRFSAGLDQNEKKIVKSQNSRGLINTSELIAALQVFIRKLGNNTRLTDLVTYLESLAIRATISDCVEKEGLLKLVDTILHELDCADLSSVRHIPPNIDNGLVSKELAELLSCLGLCNSQSFMKASSTTYCENVYMDILTNLVFKFLHNLSGTIKNK